MGALSLTLTKEVVVPGESVRWVCCFDALGDGAVGEKEGAAPAAAPSSAQGRSNHPGPCVSISGW